MQYNTIQYNTIQYNTNTIQYNTIQYNTNTIQHNTTTNKNCFRITIQYKYNTIQYNYNTIRYNTIRYKYNTIQLLSNLANFTTSHTNLSACTWRSFQRIVQTHRHWAHPRPAQRFGVRAHHKVSSMPTSILHVTKYFFHPCHTAWSCAGNTWSGRSFECRQATQSREPLQTRRNLLQALLHFPRGRSPALEWFPIQIESEIIQ